MKYRNSVTGEEFETPDDPASRSLYLFKRACIGIDRLAREFGLQLYFVSLTLRGENVDKLNSDLNKFLNFVRARFRRSRLMWFYLWVVELQKKRYYESGVKALHWHIAGICEDGALPNVRFNSTARRKYQVLREGSLITTKELYKGWGYGQVLCKEAWSSGVYDYLSKYFTKDYASLPDYNPEWAKLRRFGCSQMGYYRFPRWAFDTVKEKILLDPSFADFAIKKEGARVNFYGYEMVKNWEGKEKRKLAVVDSIKSPWSRAL